MSYTSGTLSSSSLSGVTTTYGSDSIGARTSTTVGSGSPSSYSYNQLGELVGATPSGGSAYSYGYNGDGLRMSKTVSSTTEAFTYDLVTGGSTPALLVDGSTNFIYGPNNQVIEQEDGSSSGAPQFLVHDQIGSTRLLVNALGAVDMTTTYDPYGKVTSTSGSASTPIGYAGAYTDAETGFLYLTHRYYDPSTGQFLSVDLLVDDTDQAYAYTGDDPMNGSDPMGLCSDAGGAFLVPGPCEFSNPHWVSQAEQYEQFQKKSTGFSATKGFEAVATVAGTVQNFSDAATAGCAIFCFPVLFVSIPVSEASGAVATASTCIAGALGGSTVDDCVNSLQIQALSAGFSSGPAVDSLQNLYAWVVQSSAAGAAGRSDRTSMPCD